jgi:ABC-type dipeptide/oligopeptide/nickel transport system permease component
VLFLLVAETFHNIIALFFVVINLAVDLLYYAVDPRLRIERAAMAH